MSNTGTKRFTLDRFNTNTNGPDVIAKTAIINCRVTCSKSYYIHISKCIDLPWNTTNFNLSLEYWRYTKYLKPGDTVSLVLDGGRTISNDYVFTSFSGFSYRPHGDRRVVWAAYRTTDLTVGVTKNRYLKSNFYFYHPQTKFGAR